MVAFCIGRSKLEDMTPVENALSGSLASIFASIAICPTELVKCKLQARKETFPGIQWYVFLLFLYDLVVSFALYKRTVLQWIFKFCFRLMI